MGGHGVGKGVPPGFWKPHFALISAYEQMKLEKQEDWKDMVDMFMDDPQTATDCLVFGMNMDQRKQVQLGKGKKSVHTWV